MLNQHAPAISQVLKHFVLQSFGLKPERVPEGRCAAPEQIKLRLPIEPVPLCQQGLAVLQFGLPLLPPIGAQAARHDHADQSDQPEPETEASWECGVIQQNHSQRKATIGSILVARRAGNQQASSATMINSSGIIAKVSGSVA